MYRNSLFANDPFFSSHMAGMQQMEQSMESMMHNLMDPYGFFGGQRQQAIAYDAYNRDYNRRGERQNSRQLQQLAQQQQLQRQMHPMSMFNFGGFGMMGNMHNMLQQQMVQSQADPNSQFYSQSSVMSYQNTGDGRPRIYQASTSQGQSNGVKEVRRSVRDSAQGVEKMSISREMGDKSQVITKERNSATGDLEEEKELVNLDEEEEDQFAREFRQRMQQGPYQPHRGSPHTHPMLGHRPEHHHSPALALEAAAPPRQEAPRHEAPRHDRHVEEERQPQMDRDRYRHEVVDRHPHQQDLDAGGPPHMPRYGAYETQTYRERD